MLSIHFDVVMYECNSVFHGAGGIPPQLSACTNCGNQALFLRPGNEASNLYDSKNDHVIGDSGTSHNGPSHERTTSL